MYTFKNVYYLKDIELGGLGFTGEDLKLWHKIAIPFAILILFAQPKIVPRFISY